MAIYMLSLDALLELADANHEVFTFVPHGTNETMLFNATKIRKHCEENPDDVTRSMVVVHQQMIDQIVNRGGCEEAKVMRLFTRPDIWTQPVIYLDMEDGTHVLCDGNHRFIIQVVMFGAPMIDSYLVPKKVWEKYVLPLRIGGVT